MPQHHLGREDLPPAAEAELRRLSRVILQQIELRSFEASPESVAPLEATELVWSVTGPDDPSWGVALNGNRVSRSGRSEVTLRGASRTFKLEAQAPFASKDLGQVRVSIDLSGCDTGNEIPASAIVTGVSEKVRSLVPNSGRIRLKRDPEVHLGAGTLTVVIPAAVEIPNFFDADGRVDLRFQVGLSASFNINVTLDDVDVDVEFDIHEHIFSAGSASIVQATAQTVMEACLELLGDELGRQASAELRAVIPDFCEVEDFSDLLLVDLELSETGLRFTCCTPDEQPSFTGVVAVEIASGSQVRG